MRGLASALMTASDLVSGDARGPRGPIPAGGAVARPETFRGHRRDWPQDPVHRALPAALVAVIFWFALPRRFGVLWAASRAHQRDRHRPGCVVDAGGSSLAAWSLKLDRDLSGIAIDRLREAAVVNLGSSAVANTLPPAAPCDGGRARRAVRMGHQHRDYDALQPGAQQMWNVFARLSLPVLAPG